MKKIKIYGGKGQIGTTLTWFTAFSIIFFIMVIFLSTILVMSANKRVYYGKDEIVLQEYSSNMKNQEALFNVFENKVLFVNENLRIKDLIIKWRYAIDKSEKDSIKELINRKFDEILNQSLGKGECYVFKAEYGLGNAEDAQKRISGQGANYYSDFVEKNTMKFDSLSKISEPTASGYIEKQRQKLLGKAIMIILLDDNTKNPFGVEMNKKEQIKVKFYLGECL